MFKMNILIFTFDQVTLNPPGGNLRAVVALTGDIQTG